MFWAVLFALLSFTATDPDLWGHTRFGLDMLDSRSIPAADPYSFTSDRPWVNHEWLSEVLMGLSYRAGGPTGMVVLKMILLVAAFGLILREFVRRDVPPMAQDLLLALAIVGCYAIVRTLRPQTFSLLLFSGFLIAVRRAEDGDRRALWLIPACMPLWPNLHGGWLVGLGVYGAWTAIRVLTPIGPSRLEWAAAGLATLLATLVNPEGVGMWRFLWDTVGLGRPDIAEWQPLLSHPLADWLPWFAVAIIAATTFVRERAWRVTDLVTVSILMFVSFRVVRVVPFFVLAVVILLGPLIGRRIRARTTAMPPPTPAALALVGGMVLVFGIGSGVATARNLTCIGMIGPWMVDREAAAFIRDTRLSGRMLTWFDWGEYAIWFLAPEIKVSMDGRRETIYSDEMLRLHYAIYRGEPGWQDAIKRLDPQHVWLPATVPTLGEIEQMGWRPLLRTSESVVLSRADLAAVPTTPSPSIPDACFPGRP